jgi:hypothetical protein
MRGTAFEQLRDPEPLAEMELANHEIAVAIAALSKRVKKKCLHVECEGPAPKAAVQNSDIC